MNSTKYKVGMLVIYCTAFLWGYKKDELSAMIFVPERTPSPAAESPEPPATSVVPQQPNNTQMPETPSPQRPQIRSGAPAMETPPAANAAQAPIYTPPANPYEGLSRQLQGQSPNQSFQEAFGSIKRDSISQKELLEKNSYFKKLSEDLEKLQGGPTPEPGPEVEEAPSEPIAPGSEANAIAPGATTPFGTGVAEQPLLDEELPQMPEDSAVAEPLPPAPEPDQLIDEIDELIYDLE